MSDGITLCCPRCGEYSALHKECESFREIDVYTCQKKDCRRRFAIELVIKNECKCIFSTSGKKNYECSRCEKLKSKITGEKQ